MPERRNRDESVAQLASILCCTRLIPVCDVLTQCKRENDLHVFVGFCLSRPDIVVKKGCSFFRIESSGTVLVRSSVQGHPLLSTFYTEASSGPSHPMNQKNLKLTGNTEGILGTNEYVRKSFYKADVMKNLKTAQNWRKTTLKTDLGFFCNKFCNTCCSRLVPTRYPRRKFELYQKKTLGVRKKPREIYIAQSVIWTAENIFELNHQGVRGQISLLIIQSSAAEQWKHEQIHPYEQSVFCENILRDIIICLHAELFMACYFELMSPKIRTKQNIGFFRSLLACLGAENIDTNTRIKRKRICAAP